MIVIEGINKTIGEKAILRNINLQIKQGETIGLIGPNGAGKSTVLNIISGLMKPSSGRIKIFGKQLKEHPLEIKNKIGFLSHDSFLYDHFSPLENLKFFAKLYGFEVEERKVKGLIREVGLAYFMHEPVRSFSRGMIQRLNIARALIHDPDILLLDEPHTSLDQQAIQILNRFISKMKKRGATIIMVTHDLKEAFHLCDRILFMKDGTIIDDFPVSEQKVNLIFEKYFAQVGSDEKNF
ncbi:heme ABC exporter ATP-binding protein CcmA [Calidifontibacillus erzurumensis]|uniref:Heme ABC exporter ATP-binding protein CcmA n=1 Tax=Calidifontibacillus erzurumensis TaxID=2741433 RepID=A0A8J8GH02_9BACI|nr:heme ABC exporter ATP-binding protein CcmA [Calidifontibacillus erzurumensis]NSL52233.1 heme ABC exporter ATP-binding protein CcmA [Calidifontibacillus erzurumensis]